MKKIEIELDKKRHFVFDLNAMAAYEDATGFSAFAIGDNLSAKAVRALLWACLIHDDESLTLQEVGGFIHAGNLGEITQKLNAAIALSTEKDAEKTEKN